MEHLVHAEPCEKKEKPPLYRRRCVHRQIAASLESLMSLYARASAVDSLGRRTSPVVGSRRTALTGLEYTFLRYRRSNCPKEHLVGL
jgi:hypothetical protein